MSILDYRIGLSDKTSKGILDSGFNLDGSEMSPQQQQEYEQFKKDNNMSSIPFRSDNIAMGMSISDAVPLSESLGITFNNLPSDSPMTMDNRIVPEEYGLEPPDYGQSELMESDTTTREGILSNALGFLANVYTGGGMKQALTTSGLGKLFSNILEAGGNTPNYQFINPNKSGFNRIASDFYDPRTGLDRFDRAKTLFGQSRTMKEFLDKLKDRRAAEAAELAAKQQAARTAIADAGSGFDDYGPGQGAGMGFGGGRSDPTDKS